LLAFVLVIWALTINGDANAYYAEGAFAASKSWSALFTNAADLTGMVSLDKGPLSDWMMGFSARLFGFGSFSMLLPNALCGVGAVLLLHATVRKTFGHPAALLAAVMLAVTPVSVAVARYNNPDALLTLLLVASAWALVRALESGRTRDVVLCGVFVGLAFNTKMLEAYLIVPGLTVAFLVAAPGSARRRIGQLLSGAGAMLVVSFVWYGTMMLIPSGDRPYVGDSKHNSWFELMLGGNGIARLFNPSHHAPATGAAARASAAVTAARYKATEGGHPGPLRLFGSVVGGQIGWLLPLALLGLIIGLWAIRSDRTASRRRAALLLFGLWALAGFVVFSFSQGLFHPYYTSAIAPPVCALAALAVVETGKHVLTTGILGRLLVAGAMIGLALLSFVILGHPAAFAGWLRWAVLAAGVLAAVPVAVGSARSRATSDKTGFPHREEIWRRIAIAGAVCAAFALLGGPLAYSIATLGHGQIGGNPLGGPDQISGHRTSAAQVVAGHNTAFEALADYLADHRGGARYAVAAVGAQLASPLGLDLDAEAIMLGGFGGRDPVPTTARLHELVRSGQLRYIVLGGATGPVREPQGTSAVMKARVGWVESHCERVLEPEFVTDANVYRCTPASASD
jgi:4-amino-4-deoxy-L-arabinose transferase-like glycosyltransferase